MQGCWNIGAWRVDLDAGWIKPRHRFRNRRVHVDARQMLVLSLLVRKPGQLVTVEQILDAAWPDRVVGRDSVSTAIYQLRQTLGDSAHEPAYIRTEARRGYRLVAPVRRASVFRARQIAIPVSVAALAAVMTLFMWVTMEHQAQGQRYLFVDSIQDQTEDAILSPLATAIDSTLLSELIGNLPGQVITQIDNHESALRLESQLVSCDLGPALVLRLLDTESDRYLWSRAYSLKNSSATQSETTLVAQAAADISREFLTL